MQSVGSFGSTTWSMTVHWPAAVKLTVSEPPSSAPEVLQIPGGVEVINQVSIASFEDLQVEIGSHVAGDEIEIAYNRRGEKMNVKLKLKPMKTEVVWLGP